MIGAALCLLTPARLAAQHEHAEAGVRGDFQRLAVNSDGSIVYIEPLDETLISRVEFTNRHRPTLEIFLYNGGSDRRVTILDYDPDHRPDFIRIERTEAAGSVEAVSFYRGPMRKVHEEGHLEHALLHSFIRKDSGLTQEIRERLAAITSAPLLKVREAPHLLPRYRSLVDTLLNVNPHTLGTEHEHSGPR